MGSALQGRVSRFVTRAQFKAIIFDGIRLAELKGRKEVL